MRRNAAIAMGLLLAGCHCPEAVRLPDARMVGLAGSASVYTLPAYTGHAIRQLAFLRDGRLLAAAGSSAYEGNAPAGLGVVDLATGARVAFEPAGGTHEDVQGIEVAAPAADGGAWLADGGVVRRLTPGQRLEDVHAFPWEAEATPTPGPPLGPTPDPTTAPTPSPAAAAPAATPSPGGPPSEAPRRWNDPEVIALADDGAGGVFAAQRTVVWRLPPGGAPQRLAELPTPILGLGRWGDGVVALTAPPASAGGVRRPSAAPPATLWDVGPGRPPRPWAHAGQVARPLAIATAPLGAVILVDGGRGRNRRGFEAVTPYDTSILRIDADGRPQPLIRSEVVGPATGGYQLLTTCAAEIGPDPYDVAALAAADDGRVAFVETNRAKLVVWRP